MIANVRRRATSSDSGERDGDSAVAAVSDMAAALSDMAAAFDRENRLNQGRIVAMRNGRTTPI
jgi:hypothetical protein